MGRFTIDVLATQCGVTTTNLRTWQRFGLIQPVCDNDGHRYYSFTHVSRVASIVDWFRQGATLEDMQALLKGDKRLQASGWLPTQEALLALCQAGEPQKLRNLLWRYGREIPPVILLNEVLRPLRLWLHSGDQPELALPCALLDTAITEYAAFVVASGRKKPCGSVLLLALTPCDSLELWLEAIRYASEGLRVELLLSPQEDPDFDWIKPDHVVIWAEQPLSEHQQNRLNQWQAVGLSILLQGPAAGQQEII